MDCSFDGDPAFTGDGGRLLQQLWERYPWKMIRGCPGRYTSRSKPLRLLSLEEVAQSLPGGQDLQVTSEVHLPGKDPITMCRFPDGGGIITYIKTAPAVSPAPTAHTPATPSTGSASSSSSTTGTQPPPIRVHTLNTESGFARKLEALGIPWFVPHMPTTDCPQGAPSVDGRRVRAAQPGVREATRDESKHGGCGTGTLIVNDRLMAGVGLGRGTLCMVALRLEIRILEYLEEMEKNDHAYALCTVVMTKLTSRAGAEMRNATRL